MPCNEVSNDLDLVRKDPKPSKVLKEPPSKPWRLPKFSPVKITKPFTDGQSQLSSTTVAFDVPYAIFNLSVDMIEYGRAELKTHFKIPSNVNSGFTTLFGQTSLVSNLALR